MDFSEALTALADKSQKVKSGLNTEQATKTALVLPFIRALGYDVFNPFEVVPEFIADVAGRKGEKVDYAIMQDDKPIMIIECKTCGTNLNDINREQLHRYFLTLDSSIGILTDGIRYLFFSNGDDGKHMDATPFMEFSLDNIDPTLIQELRKLCKGKFDLKKTQDTVNELKFNRQIKLLLTQNLETPTDGFIGYFMGETNTRGTAKAREQFVGYVKRAFKEFVDEQVDGRLKKALSDTSKKEDASSTGAQADVQPESQSDGIETTQEEIEGYHIVKSILREIIDPDRIILSDGVNYCSVVLDNWKKVVCRMHFNSPKRKIFETLDMETKVNTKHEIESLNDIYRYADALKATVVAIDAKSKKSGKDSGKEE